MGDNFASLHSTFSVEEEIVEGDTRFLKIVVDAMHLGENKNRSYFEKDVVDECIESVKNTPILGFIKCDNITGENDFKGHEYILKRTENGIEEVYFGRAYGVVPESCNPRWITKVCDDGIEREFLQVDALVWEKFSDATSIIKRDGEKSESMELEVSSVEGYDDENGIFHFTKFRFDGFCILGDNVPPAMMNASVRVDDGVNFTMSDITDRVRCELSDKFELFNATFAKLANDNIKDNQGGVENMSEVNTEFEQTVMEQFEDMAVIVAEHETIKDWWGDDVQRYYIADIQGDEVITVDANDYYRYYGFPFVIDGDKPVIDFENGKRKKIVFADYEDGESVQESNFEFGEHISKIKESAEFKLNEANEKIAEFEAKESESVEKIAEFEAKLTEMSEKLSESEEKIADFETKLSEAEENYTQIKSEFDEIKPKYDEYVEAEEQRVIEEINAQKDAVFAEYESDLADNTEFVALKEQKDEMSVDDIEKECALMYVKMSRTKNKFSASDSNSAVVGVMNDVDSAEADGLVLTKYGLISINK